MNVVDSSGWLEYVADTKRARLFAPAIEDPDHLLVPVIAVLEGMPGVRHFPKK